MSKVPINPLGNNIVIQEEKVEQKTVSGLLLLSNNQKDSKQTIVVAVGKDVTDISIGDRILCKEYSATQVKIGAEEYLIISESDVIAKVVT